MKVDKKRCKELMEQKNISIEEMSHKTGLTQRSLMWILENGYASEDAAERMASVLEVSLGEIYKNPVYVTPGKEKSSENAIEFIKDGSRATVTFSQGRYKTRIKELAKKHPDECEIMTENKDGSMLAHIPVEWIRINPGKDLTDERKERLAELARSNFCKSNNRSETD